MFSQRQTGTRAAGGGRASTCGLTSRGHAWSSPVLVIGKLDGQLGPPQTEKISCSRFVMCVEPHGHLQCPAGAGLEGSSVGQLPSSPPHWLPSGQSCGGSVGAGSQKTARYHRKALARSSGASPRGRTGLYPPTEYWSAQMARASRDASAASTTRSERSAQLCHNTTQLRHEQRSGRTDLSANPTYADGGKGREAVQDAHPRVRSSCTTRLTNYARAPSSQPDQIQIQSDPFACHAAAMSCIFLHAVMVRQIAEPQRSTHGRSKAEHPPRRGQRPRPAPACGGGSVARRCGVWPRRPAAEGGATPSDDDLDSRATQHTHASQLLVKQTEQFMEAHTDQGSAGVFKLGQGGLPSDSRET